MNEEQVYQFAYVGIFSMSGTDPEETRHDLEDWMRQCLVGALDGMCPLNVHVADAMIYRKNSNAKNEMCCRMESQNSILDECTVEYMECEEFNSAYRDLLIIEGVEGTPCKFLGKEDGQKVILTEKASGYISLDKQLLSATYFDILSLAKLKGGHSISFPVGELKIQGKPVEYSAYTVCHTISCWYRENSDHGMKVTFLCPDEETLAAYEQCAKY